ncbi:DUF2460 domain-containing protein [Acuticoccus sp. M5D2P5]|uniref:DUF2460 domain-containing protein n=1 Tax=Acuticoccus kalidii TaxID=2910977 RepID=UPI001F2B2FA8|nr:DUF2460 domain-containing protein [Acuticoccus kalidii]MCF3934454.1 DUF2460 domain-containing protein [Acuticoccus kalidii]
MDGFHDVRFPLAVSFGATGGPERRTEIVTLGSNREERNQRWHVSRRRFEAGTGIRNKGDLYTVIDFFEERRGRLYGFRYRDPLDNKSCAPGDSPAADDQLLGVGDGVKTSFALIKRYGEAFLPYDRLILLPVPGSVFVEVAGVSRVEGADFTVTDGVLTFFAHAVPGEGEGVTAGFLFDVPARFDTDRLEINLSRFEAGSIPSVPVVEIVP